LGELDIKVKNKPISPPGIRGLKPPSNNSNRLKTIGELDIKVKNKPIFPVLFQRTLALRQGFPIPGYWLLLVAINLGGH
jgi:hypothetical protein